MKKALLLGALLSTMAFGAAGEVSGQTGLTSSTEQIKFTGTALKALKITADETTVNFGTLVIGQKSTATVGLTLEGADTKTANLEAKVTIDDEKDPGSVVASFTGTGAGTVSFTSGAGKDELTLVYTPTKDGEISGNVVVTATYND